MTNGPATPTPGDDRRRNLLLRHLVDDLLSHIRELQQHAGPWSPEERERAEADLERIMQRVRGESFPSSS